MGKDPHPSAAIMDSQSVKTTEEGAMSNGYDAHKNVKGRKRHLLVDTLGLPLSIYVTPANVQDRVGARCLLAGLKSLVPRLKKIWADGLRRRSPYGMVPERRRVGPGGGRAEARGRRYRGHTKEMDRGADFLLDMPVPQDEQGLRTEGAD